MALKINFRELSCINIYNEIRQNARNYKINEYFLIL